MTLAGEFEYGSITPSIEAACEKLLTKLREAKHSNIQMFHLALTGHEPAANAWGIMDDGVTNVFDGTTLPAVVDVHSTADADGTGSKSVTILGLDDAGALTEEDITFTDTAGTVDVMTTTTEWTRIIGIINIDTAGTITLTENGANVDCYATLTAGNTHTLSTRFWIPTGYEGMLGYLSATTSAYNLGAVADNKYGLDNGDSVVVNAVETNGFIGEQKATPLAPANTSYLMLQSMFGSNAAVSSVEVIYFYWVA